MCCVLVFARNRLLNKKLTDFQFIILSDFKNVEGIVFTEKKYYSKSADL